ncbi:MAG: hypothetical protein ACLUEQ_12345 [Cloacibacillus evryensis]
MAEQGDSTRYRKHSLLEPSVRLVLGRRASAALLMREENPT